MNLLVRASCLGCKAFTLSSAVARLRRDRTVLTHSSRGVAGRWLVTIRNQGFSIFDSRRVYAAILALLIWGSIVGPLNAQADDKEANKLVISSIQVNDKVVPMRVNQALKLGANAGDVVFRFGAANPDWMPNRLRYKLDG